MDISIIFYLSSTIMILSALALLLVKEALNGAVFLIISLLALSIDFYLLGSPFIAMLQVILYVGAIMVLYVFFIMMHPGASKHKESKKSFIIPLILLTVLIFEIVYMLYFSEIKNQKISVIMINPKALGSILFGSYKIAIEAVSTLLLASLIAVIYLARPFNDKKNKKLGEE